MSDTTDMVARTEKEIGSVLRYIRQRKGLTQQQVADSVRLRQATMSGIENGKPSTHLETLVLVLAALDLELVVRPRTRAVQAEIDEIDAS